MPYEIETLDPHAEAKLGNVSVLSNIYDPLVTTDAGMRVQPCLATSWETPNSQTWILHLRPSVSFHSGRSLRAADVLYSLNRVLHDSALGMSSTLVDVTRVRQIDDLTVEIRTSRPRHLRIGAPLASRGTRPSPNPEPAGQHRNQGHGIDAPMPRWASRL
ncbi:MAG: ABC transporter substrate-binding protein [Acidobacteriota bacterium]